MIYPTIWDVVLSEHVEKTMEKLPRSSQVSSYGSPFFMARWVRYPFSDTPTWKDLPTKIRCFDQDRNPQRDAEKHPIVLA